ncbi:unnamed protein product [Closterium sp. NIES-65]|nr:unnamed protein product [Closterium sp. NIES-65]CAI5970507.1 unnamed protein product [Closterium sp. NIES-65]
MPAQVWKVELGKVAQGEAEEAKVNQGEAEEAKVNQGEAEEAKAEYADSGGGEKVSDGGGAVRARRPLPAFADLPAAAPPDSSAVQPAILPFRCRPALRAEPSASPRLHAGCRGAGSLPQRAVFEDNSSIGT